MQFKGMHSWWIKERISGGSTSGGCNSEGFTPGGCTSKGCTHVLLKDVLFRYVFLEDNYS